MGSPHLHHASDKIQAVAVDLQNKFFLPHSAHRWLTCLSEWHLHYQNCHCNTCMTWRSLPNMQARTQARGLHCCVLTWRGTSVSIQIKFWSLLSLLHEENRSLIHCLELVEYVSDLCDIQMLATSRNDMDLKDVAHKLEHLCLEKMLQLEYMQQSREHNSRHWSLVWVRG